MKAQNDLSTDEPSLKICMNCSSSLRSLHQPANLPAFNLYTRKNSWGFITINNSVFNLLFRGAVIFRGESEWRHITWYRHRSESLQQNKVLYNSYERGRCIKTSINMKSMGRKDYSLQLVYTIVFPFWNISKCWASCHLYKIYTISIIQIIEDFKL